MPTRVTYASTSTVSGPPRDPADTVAGARLLPPTATSLAEVLASAARLQELVPDAVLVGGTAVALHAGHRESHDHDHVLADLSVRFDTVLEALEREPDWVTNRVTPGKIILGSLGGIEAGVRFYADTTKAGDAVATQLVRQLGNPRPRDLSSVAELARYKGLQARWNTWAAVREQCQHLGAEIVLEPDDADLR